MPCLREKRNKKKCAEEYRLQQSVKRDNWPTGRGPGGLADAPDKDLVALVQDGPKNRLISNKLTKKPYPTTTQSTSLQFCL